VRIIWRIDVNDLDQGRFDDFTPSGGGKLPSHLDASRLHAGSVAAANGVKLDLGFERKKIRRLPPGVRVSFSHETVSDHPDPKRLGHT
jgi:hypothetical protein